MAVKGFSFEPELVQLFIELGYAAHADDHSWVPPFEAEIEHRLSRQFHFHQRPGNAHRCFLATAHGRPLARVLAAVNRDLRDEEGDPVGVVGMFDSLDETSAARDVLQAAVDWLRRQGIGRIWGPMDFDIWHGYRFMTRGFELCRLLGEPYNPPHYPGLFEALGFEARCRWNSFELGSSRTILSRLCGEPSRVGLAALGYRVSSFDSRRFAQSVATLHAAITRSFSEFLGFTPIDLPVFQRVMASARYAVDDSCSFFVHDAGGRLAGFAVSFLNLAPAVRQMKGQRGIGARIGFAWRRSRARSLLLHLAGVVREGPDRRPGLAELIHRQLLERVATRGFEQVFATLVAQGNPVRRLLEGAVLDQRREYTLYELAP